MKKRKRIVTNCIECTSLAHTHTQPATRSCTSERQCRETDTIGLQTLHSNAMNMIWRHCSHSLCVHPSFDKCRIHGNVRGFDCQARQEAHTHTPNRPDTSHELEELLIFGVGSNEE